MTIACDAEWPWYVAGPLIGLFVPALLIAGNKVFGISSNLRHLCAAIAPCKVKHFRYDWKQSGLWNLVFLSGVLVGGFLAAHLGASQTISISPATRELLIHQGFHDFSGVAPGELFSWHALLTLRGFVSIVVGGFLVGFGTAYAGGCTSGHAISGLANLQLPSLIAVLGFFAGGLFATYFILPHLIGAL
ncbi:MAG TPA: YeeE/YedE thiosulfate transporter family protein [Terracidiphilus sp.]